MGAKRWTKKAKKSFFFSVVEKISTQVSYFCSWWFSNHINSRKVQLRSAFWMGKPNNKDEGSCKNDAAFFGRHFLPESNTNSIQFKLARPPDRLSYCSLLKSNWSVRTRMYVHILIHSLEVQETYLRYTTKPIYIGRYCAISSHLWCFFTSVGRTRDKGIIRLVDNCDIFLTLSFFRRFLKLNI